MSAAPTFDQRLLNLTCQAQCSSAGGGCTWQPLRQRWRFALYCRDETMNSRRVLLALLIALLLSGAVTFFISRKLSSSSNTHPKVQRYVAASRSLDAGEVLKAEDLVLID